MVKVDIIFIAVCMCTQVMMHIKLYYDMAFLVKCILVCQGHSYFMTDRAAKVHILINYMPVLLNLVIRFQHCYFGDMLSYYFF